VSPTCRQADLTKAFFYSDYYSRLMREMSDRGVKAAEADVAYHGRANFNTVKVS